VGVEGGPLKVVGWVDHAGGFGDEDMLMGWMDYMNGKVLH